MLARALVASLLTRCAKLPITQINAEDQNKHREEMRWCFARESLASEGATDLMERSESSACTGSLHKARLARRRLQQRRTLAKLFTAALKPANTGASRYKCMGRKLAQIVLATTGA